MNDRAVPGVPRAGCTTTVDVAGLRLRVDAATDDDLALVTRVVGTHAVGGRPHARLELGPVAPPLPDRPPDFEGPYGDHWDDGVTHAFRHHWGLGAVVTADRAVLGGRAHGYERWVTVRNSMLFVLARLFLLRDRYLLHGAALRRDEHALVVVGDSGAGKSTLAFLAHRAGWHVLGDDMVVVDPTEPITVRGVPRVPSVPNDVAALTAVDGTPLPEDGRDRLELADFELDPASAPVDGMVVCGHGDASGDLTRTDAATVLGALVPAFVLSALEEPVRRWFPVASALARRPGVVLRHAADPVQRLAGTAALLDEAARLVDGNDRRDPADGRSGAQRP